MIQVVIPLPPPAALEAEIVTECELDAEIGLNPMRPLGIDFFGELPIGISPSPAEITV